MTINKRQRIIIFFYCLLVSGLPLTSLQTHAEEDINEPDIITSKIITDLINYPDTPETNQTNKRGTTRYQPQDIGTQGPLTILGEHVQPGKLTKLNWSAGQSFSGRTVNPPVLIARGNKPGAVLCLVAAIHGDEINGIEIVRRVLSSIDPAEMAGTVIGVPIVNIFGFTHGSRYLPDRRDLNRYFPGRADGSAAARIAYRFFNQIISHCDLLVDFHTGSFKRDNLPQLRADMRNSRVREFSRHFGSTTVLHKQGNSGILRSAATSAGIPAITFELGQTGSLQNRLVETGVTTINTMMGNIGILDNQQAWSEPQPVYYKARWVRVNSGGIMISQQKIGAFIKKNNLLGYIINPFTNEKSEIRSPVNGRILGMALNQFMLPGYAAFHLGIETEGNSKLSTNGVFDMTDDQIGNTENEDNSVDSVEQEDELH